MRCCRVGVLTLICALSACGDCGQGCSVMLKLSYNGSTPFPAAVGETILLTPTVSMTMEHYSVKPALPSGLSIDELSGAISGTPTKESSAATYVVSATGAAGRVTFPLVLSVTEPPSRLSYVNPASATVGVALAPLVPSIRGSADHYAVSPTLPPGMLLDSTSGVLSGTPSEARNLTPYTITASSLVGSTHFILLLTVTPASARAIPKHRPARGTGLSPVHSQ